MIDVQHLTRRYGGVAAVEDLSFRLERGEVVGFLGPNGAGKTTTLRILAGYLPATSGSVRVAGLDVLRQSLEVRRRIGYLPESVPLYREHRVEEMLLFQARLHGLSRSQWKARIPAVLERVGIGERARSLIGHLSRGQRQRVGLALALLPSPQVLLLDEPTSGLDPLQRIEVRGLLRDLAREHTVLLSSHILPEIEAVCPRVIILSRGRMAADGAPADLVTRHGGASHVRVEAVVGADPAVALRSLAALRGVRSVEDDGRVGIHHVFRVRCDVDLREDVGALAAHKGWALRELSWQRPTLEQIFARIALGLDAEASTQAPEAASPPVTAAQSDAASAGIASASMGLTVLASKVPPPGSDSGAPGLGVSGRTARAGKPVYNLNPFEHGGARDLSKPAPVRAAEQDAPSRCAEGSQPQSGASGAGNDPNGPRGSGSPGGAGGPGGA